MRLTLRPYQKTSINDLCNMYRHNKRIVLVSPTGSGKTVIASRIIESAVKTKYNKVLFIAHRRELINQCSNKLDDFGIRHGVIMGNHPKYDPSAKVQVASIQTLINRGHIDADFIIIDECHRSLSKSYVSVVNRYNNIPVLGLTATPWRGDGKGLNLFYEKMLVVSQVNELIRDGYLLDPVVYSPNTPNLDHIRIMGGDYVDTELEKIMLHRKLTNNIVNTWCEKTLNKKTVIFACTVKHSIDLVNAFRQASIPAEHLDANTPAYERDAILNRIKTGETKVLSNVGVLTEGWDCPELECIILARPTKSITLYLQMVGRCMRPCTGKDKVYVLDHAGCTKEHGLVSDYRDFNLDGKYAHGTYTFVCPNCMKVSDYKIRLCECGYTTKMHSLSMTKDQFIDNIDKYTKSVCYKCGSNNIVKTQLAGIKLIFGRPYKCNKCDYVSLFRGISAVFSSKDEKDEERALIQTIAAKLGESNSWVNQRYNQIF